MSRLAKKPVTIPEGVTFTASDDHYLIKGSKGQLEVPKLAGVQAEEKDGGLVVTLSDEERQSRSNLGTLWSLLNNAAIGVSEGYEKKLEIHGVGYKGQMKKKIQ
mgnify:CR=1 FL=1